MEPRNRFPAWRIGTTTLFDVPAHHRQAGIPGLLKRLQIRAQAGRIEKLPPSDKIKLYTCIIVYCICKVQYNTAILRNIPRRKG